jgi:uncharacterized protein
MNLTLTYRWEHALIAAAIEMANKKCSECYLGRTAIQKLLYFLKVRGVPMTYSFDVHHYGPFCQHVMSDVEWLLADDVIEDKSSEPRYSNYRPGSTWPALQQQFGEKLARHRQVVEEVCDALSGLQPDELELIATLDFSFRWVRAGGGKGPWKDRTIKKFKSIKMERFSDDQIEKGFRTLVAADLIED